MMMVVAGKVDGVAHLRQLRNQIVFGSQNPGLNKTKKNCEKVTHLHEYSISLALRMKYSPFATGRRFRR